MELLKSISITFWSRVLVLFISLIADIIIARILGPTGKGIYSLIILIPSLLILVSTLGINISNIYYIGKKRFKEEDIVSNSLLFGIGIGTLIIVLLVMFLNYYPNLFFKDIELKYLKIIIFIVPFLLIQSFFASILLVKGKVLEFNLISIFRYSFLLLFISISLVILKRGVMGALLSWLVASALSSLFSVWLIKKIIRIRLSFKGYIFKKTLKFGIKGYIGNVVQFLNYRLDMFLINFLIGVTQVGFYSIAVVFAEMMWFIPNTIQTILFPKVSSSMKKEATEITSIICRHTVFLTSVVAIFSALIAKSLISIVYTPAYLPSVKPLLILLPGVVALSCSKILTSYLTGVGFPIVGTKGSIIALAVNIPLNIILIPKFGISGAAIATTVSYSLLTLFVLYNFLQISKVRIGDILIIKKSDFMFYLSFIKKIHRKIV